MHYSETYRRYPKRTAGVDYVAPAATASRQITADVKVDVVNVGHDYQVRTHGLVHPLTGEVGVFIENGGHRKADALVVFEATCARVTNEVA